MVRRLIKILLSPFSFFAARAKSIASLSKQLSRVGRGEYAHAVDGGFESAIAAEPAGRRAPAPMIAQLRMIACGAQIAAVAAVGFTVWWAITSSARMIEIANFVVFSAGLTIAACVAAFAVSVARGGKRSFWRIWPIRPDCWQSRGFRRASAAAENRGKAGFAEGALGTARFFVFVGPRPQDERPAGAGRGTE